MLSRVRFDIGAALADANREALDAAAIRCVLCRAHGACDAWTAKHGQGKGLEVPAFCTNKDYVAAFQPPGHDAPGMSRHGLRAGENVTRPAAR